MSGLYALGATCSSKTGQGYASSYDSWGNVSSRTFSGTSATLSYDLLDHFTKWFVSNSNTEFYAYDAAGNRVLRRSTNGSGTSMTVYAFGLEEHQYSGSGTNQGNTYYYSLGGKLLGSLDSNGTQFYLSDALGSVVSAFTNAAGGAALKGNQLFGPYGSPRYYAGNINTAKGFIGQYNDGTGLDYLHARYYDPVVGVFLSADTAQGNAQGLNPYAYVNGNPQTRSDPTGRYIGTVTPITQKGGAMAYINPATGASMTIVNDGYSVTSIDGQSSSNRSGLDVTIYTYGPTDPSNANYDPNTDYANSPWAKFSRDIGLTDMVTTFSDPNASFWDKLFAVPKFLWTSGNYVLQLAMIFDGGAEAEGVVASGEEGASVLSRLAEGCGALSFAPTTLVAAAQGEQAIGKLHIGDKVWAYNPTTQKMELEPVRHVWINHDHDLVDLTLTSSTHLPQSGKLTRKSEVIHTNKKHPFLTREKGFLEVGQIKLGMHVLRADGTYGVVTGWKAVPGVKVMYNLEVAQDHTFTVGSGQWVVHNCASPLGPKPSYIPDRGTLSVLWENGYKMSEHFVQSFLSRGAGLSAQDVVRILENGSAYIRDGDTFISITGQSYGGRTMTVVYNQFVNELHTIFDRGFPVSGFNPVDNPFDPFSP